MANLLVDHSCIARVQCRSTRQRSEISDRPV